MRRQTAGIADEVGTRQGHDCGQLLQEFQRRQFNAGRAVRPRFCERVHEIPSGIFLKTLKRHGASCGVPNQALQLVAPVRWDLGVGVERKPVDTGTAGSCEFGTFPFLAKA